MSRFLDAVVSLLVEYIPSLKNGVDEDHVTVEDVVEVYPQWDMSEQ